MKRAGRTLGWIAVAALALVPVWTSPPAAEQRPGAPIARLLGPIGSLAASAQWVRVSQAMRAGRGDVVLARAELALALDPESTEAWTFYSRHLALDRASRTREPDPARRAAWLRVAIDVIERGEERASHPEELAFWAGLILGQFAEVDPELPWRGGRRGLWEDAAAAFERAAERGHPEGAEFAAAARRSAARDPAERSE